MRVRFFLLASAAFALPLVTAGMVASGCGPSVQTVPPSVGGGGFGGWTTTSSTTHTIPPWWDGGQDALPDYEDPGCPDAGPPVQQFECDPFHQNDGSCPPGEGCYIFVLYPSEPCGQETYGAQCQAVGIGTQGTGCNGFQDCAAGYCCVVSGAGNQCVQLCPLTGASGCPEGFTCEAIDVEGFGGCL
jgi:hypothetical protein